MLIRISNHSHLKLYWKTMPHWAEYFYTCVKIICLLSPSFQISSHVMKSADDGVWRKMEHLSFSFLYLQVHRCLKEGSLESPTLPISESLSILRILDTVRAHIGVEYDLEKGRTRIPSMSDWGHQWVLMSIECIYSWSGNKTNHQRKFWNILFGEAMHYFPLMTIPILGWWSTFRRIFRIHEMRSTLFVNSHGASSLVIAVGTVLGELLCLSNMRLHIYVQQTAHLIVICIHFREVDINRSKRCL